LDSLKETLPSADIHGKLKRQRPTFMKMNLFDLSLPALAMALCMFSIPGLQAQTVRLQGAVTLSKLITEQQSAIESQAGVKLEVVGNGTGRGVSALLGGQADIALVAGSLKGAADAMNKEKPGSVDITGLRENPVSSVKLLIVVHPAVGAKTLTDAQLKDVLTGKATNWKDVGGADQPVKLVLPFAGDGARITVQELVMNGADFAKDPILRNSSKDIAPVITQLPGSISFLSEKNAAGLSSVAVEKPLSMPLILVTKGEPDGAVKKVVDAVKTVIK
jgi:phosphate transport system substrate-binding protein